jgi:hypothetical protein
MSNNEFIQAPVAVEPVIIRRGGLNSYDESKGSTVQQVRGEFLSDTFKPKITMAFDSVTFNSSCVNLFPDERFVVISIDEPNLRLFVEPCSPYDRNYLKFANYKNGKNVPRKCIARYFCGMLFELMNWNRCAKYKCLAIFQEFDGKKIIVFNLDECQQVFAEQTVVDDGKKKRTTTVNMPAEWQGRFGYTMDELEAKRRVDFRSTLVTIDNSTGEKQNHNIIEPKMPTTEELIHAPYGGIRQKYEENSDEED